MKIDKQNGDVAFNELDHLYFNVKYPDRKYTSVTTLIGKYHEKFDADFWSSYKALEKIVGEEFVTSGMKSELLNKKKFDMCYVDTMGVDTDEFLQCKEDILASYKKANTEACDRGTAYHLAKELRFYEKGTHKLTDYEFGLDLHGEFLCEKHNFDLNDDHRILPEYLIYWSSKDGVLNLAGQIDMLIKDGNDLYLLDYKTNAKGIETKAYFDRKKKKTKRMHYPLNNIDDTTYMHYTLQLSIYAWMLQRINPNFNIKLLRILHIDKDGVETQYDLEYKKHEVECLMKHYKKALVATHFRETGKILNEKGLDIRG